VEFAKGGDLGLQNKRLFVVGKIFKTLKKSLICKTKASGGSYVPIC
jgi:hypothetical protein